VSPRKLSQRVQSALVVLALVGVTAAGYFFLISPKRSSAVALEKEIVAVQEQIDERLAKMRVPERAPLDVPDLFQLARAIPDETDMSEIILELDRVASASGLQFESISPQTPVAGKGFQVLPITLALDGRYSKVSSFLGRLRSLVRVRGGKLRAKGRLFTVESVSLAESEKLFPNLRATMTVNAFVFGGSAAAAPDASTTPKTPEEPDAGTTTTSGGES
jgi:Tfp pilus assembly protein PilO